MTFIDLGQKVTRIRVLGFYAKSKACHHIKTHQSTLFLHNIKVAVLERMLHPVPFPRENTRRTPKRKVLLACSAIRPPSARRQLSTELLDTAPSPSSYWHTLIAVRSSSACSTCAAMSAVLTASFTAVSSATFCLSSDQRNQDKLR